MKAIPSKGTQFTLIAGLTVAAALLFGTAAQAQTSNVIQDTFTGTTAQLQWKALNGACLTAGNGQAAANGGLIPSCAGLVSSGAYYNGTNETMVGLGTSNADSVGNGALRLTNSFNENGAIIDTQSYPSNQGIQVTFTTYTYGGNAGGTAKDGADGIGFYLLGATSVNNIANTLNNTAAAPSLGAFGGSLGYSCSNTNSPYDGMTGAYMGLGIDEFGNFLNAPDNTGTGSQASSSNGGDGKQYQPGRIGLRAYGNVNLTALQSVNANATKSDVQATCKNGGTYNWSTTDTAHYNLSYTYPNNSGTTPLKTTQISTATTYVWTKATYSSNGNTKTASDPTSVCPGSAAVANPATSTGGLKAGSGSTSTYTGNLYQLAAPSPQTPQVSPQTQVNNNYTTTNRSGNRNYTCTGTQTVVTTTTTQETDYTFTQQGATNTTPSTSNDNGYAGTGQMYGLVNGVYYPISFSFANVIIQHSQSFPDYAAIPNAFVNLPSGSPIANENAKSRSAATPISYKLQITQAGLLSLWYSYNQGTYTPVLTGQSITQGNAPIPSSFLFGFGGSTGGSSNVHEITCFQVTPAETSASSAGLNVQSGEVRTGTQVYLASYHINNWWGQLTAQNLVTNGGVISISPTANWDASCVLTGGACSSTGGNNTVQDPSKRVLLTYQDSVANASTVGGIQLAWANLSSTAQGWLNGDGNGQNRLSYLMGDRSNEIPTSGYASPTIFRDRNSVLGDIIDSSPTWVGPPSAPYADTWGDKLNSSATMAENATSAVKYSAFVAAKATRVNVVYDGANDGFLHGFRTGSYDSNGNYQDNATTPNDGLELLAYMPQAILQTIYNQNNSAVDYSSAKYSHSYFVDATPGTGDLFYNGDWHTWLVSGLGTGGSAIFALDITDPASFTAANASSVVKGEWSGATLSCVGNSNCGNDLGQTTGTPQIRRLHNGEWGIIFGNGLNSSGGDAGIFVMTISSSGALDKVYFLDTGVGAAANPNGIAYVTPVDLDGDHITDYVYAGDVYGNVWRFDLTSSTATNWAASNYGQSTATPLFTTPTTTVVTTKSTGKVTTTIAPTALISQPATANTASLPNGVSTDSSGNTTLITNQPITTQLTAIAVSTTSTGQPRIMIEFGTGLTVPQTSTSDVKYAPGQQALYGIWDWYVGVAGTANAQYGGLSTAPSQITLSTLQSQAVTGTFSAAQSGIGQGARTVSNNAICFVGTSCQTIDSKGNISVAAGTMMGWYMNLPGFNGVTAVGGNNQTEQVIYSPLETDGAFIVNTTVPANNSALTCTAQSALGWTMALNPATGGAFQNSFFSDGGGNFVTVGGSPISGIALNGTGSPSVVTANGLPYLVTQNVQGVGAVNRILPPGSKFNKRLTWLQVH
ncbi:PilC/PilY family type IV pilus protein [Dyella kyungheensis]|uniref:PilC/PilY family type IV pilus protein n=1 Tax=Dyella kyungheensis TaxID=1242174 RepID=UPI003CF1866F